MVECRNRPGAGGLSLVEVLVALGLIAISLMLILGMIPAGIQSSQRAADIQMAAAWSRQLLEEAPQPNSSTPPPDLNETKTIGSTEFQAKRTIRSTGNYLYQIQVETSWNAGVEPIRLSLTRYNPAGPPFDE